MQNGIIYLNIPEEDRKWETEKEKNRRTNTKQIIK